MGIEEVLSLPPRLLPLERHKVRFPVFDIADDLLQLLDPPFERPQERPRRASEPALEHTHRQLHCGPVGKGSAVELPEIRSCPLVELVLAVRPGAQVVAEGVAVARQVEGLPIEGHHLLLRPAEEVPPAGRLRKPPDRLPG